MNTRKRSTGQEAAKTLLRRDVLTGSALFLVASATGCTKSPPPSTTDAGSAAPPNPPASTSSGGASDVLRTQFMWDFTAKFIGDPATMPAPGSVSTWPDPHRLWPDPTKLPPVDVIEKQFEMFASLLMTFGYIDGPPPAKPNDPLAASVWQFLVDQKWPDGTPDTPKYKKSTVTKVEIAVILDRLLQALDTYQVAGSEHGSGGGPGAWPPH